MKSGVDKTGRSWSNEGYQRRGSAPGYLALTCFLGHRLSKLPKLKLPANQTS